MRLNIYSSREATDSGFFDDQKLSNTTLNSSTHQNTQQGSLCFRTYQQLTLNQRITMRVLLLGATGNLGSRLIPALLTHGHNVIAYVRSASKLEALVPATVHEQITIVQGDATDSKAIKKTIIDHKCEAVISTAGVAALAPWARSELPVIFKAVLDAVREAGTERQSPLRVWFLGGQGVLYYPGTQSMLSN